MVTTVDDSTPCEGLETVDVTISNAGNFNVLDGIGLLSITDNDPSLSIGDIVVNENDGNAVFTITPSSVCPGRSMEVDWATVDDSALAPQDYAASSGTATIAAGAPNTTVQVPLNDDTDGESTETFRVNLSNPIDAVIGDSQAVATINDDDTPPNITINDLSLTEGGTATFTVSFDRAAGEDITIDYNTGDGTANAGTDYTSASGTLTFTAGVISQNVVISVLDDGIEEGVETFNLILSNPSFGVLTDGIGEATLTDDDRPLISINDASANEGGVMTFTVSLNKTSAFNVSFEASTADASATAGTDYTPLVSSPVTILAGNTTTSVTVTTINDNIDELTNAETFSLTLGNIVNATASDPIGVGTVVDQDTVQVSVNDVSVVEGGAATLTLSLDKTSEQDVTVDWSTANNSAVSPGDFDVSSGTATVTAGSLSTTININTVDDSIFETTETFNVNLSNPTNASILDAQGQVSITNNDAAPVLAINDVTVTEQVARA